MGSLITRVVVSGFRCDISDITTGGTPHSRCNTVTAIGVEPNARGSCAYITLDEVSSETSGVTRPGPTNELKTLHEGLKDRFSKNAE